MKEWTSRIANAEIDRLKCSECGKTLDFCYHCGSTFEKTIHCLRYETKEETEERHYCEMCGSRFLEELDEEKAAEQSRYLEQLDEQNAAEQVDKR